VLFASWILPASPMTCSARPCSATSEARMAPTTRSPAGHHGNYARPLRGISGRAGRCGVMGARHGHRRRPGACHHASLAERPAVVRCWWHERVWPLGRLDDVPQACLEGLAQFRMSIAHSASTLAFTLCMACTRRSGSGLGFTLAAAVGVGIADLSRLVWSPCVFARPRFGNACREAQVACRLLRSAIATPAGMSYKDL
jgi:hypothetical protein